MTFQEKLDLIASLSSAYQRIESVHKGESGTNVTRKLLSIIDDVVSSIHYNQKEGSCGGVGKSL